MRPLDRLVAEGRARAGVPVAPLTTYKLGGPARWLAEVGDEAALAALVGALAADPVPVLVLGRGSNLVVSDAGFPGMVVRLSGDFAAVEHLPEAVRAGAAVSLPTLARSATAAGRLGLEFFVGIPGSVGGAVRQNAGCHGSETREWLTAAEVVDLASAQRRVRPLGDLGLSYRHSDLGDADLVVQAWFRFEPGDPATGEERMRAIVRWRKEHQPGGTLNAGSVFKNPPGDAAGRIIDSVGLKGFRVGGVTVSERHANFFVAGPDATAADVFALVAAVRERVEAATGVRLEPEIRFAGDFGGMR